MLHCYYRLAAVFFALNGPPGGTLRPTVGGAVPNALSHISQRCDELRHDFRRAAAPVMHVDRTELDDLVALLLR